MHVNKISWSHARDYEHRGRRSVVIPPSSVTGENGTPIFGFRTDQLDDTTLYGLGYQAKNFVNVTTSKIPETLETFLNTFADLDNPELLHTGYNQDDYIASRHEDLRYKMTVKLDKIKSKLLLPSNNLTLSVYGEYISFEMEQIRYSFLHATMLKNDG